MFGGAGHLFDRLIELVISGFVVVEIGVFAHHAGPLAPVSEVDWTILLAVVVSRVVPRICIVCCQLAVKLLDEVVALPLLIIVGV